MNEELIKSEYLKDVEAISNLQDLVEIKNKYLSKKGKVNDLMTKMKEIPAEQKAAYGQMVNNLKTYISDGLDELKIKFEQEELNKKLKSEEINVITISKQI